MKSPSWLDLRLIVGVILVIGSVVGGMAVVSSSARVAPMLAVTHDVSAGIVLQADDVRAVSVRLTSAGGKYVDSRTVVVGQTLNRDVRAGELLPRSALEKTAASTTVTIPLAADVAPRIKPGQRITVWVSTKACPSATVLADTAVQDVQDSRGSSFGSAGGESVIVRLSPEDARRVVEALALTGATIRAGVLSGPAAQASAAAQLAACADSAS